MNFPIFQGAGAGHTAGQASFVKALGASIANAFAFIGHGFSAAYTRFQVAQAATRLSHLSDRQLRDLGIKRVEIMRHAERMVSYRYDGL